MAGRQGRIHQWAGKSEKSVLAFADFAACGKGTRGVLLPRSHSRSSLVQLPYGELNQLFLTLADRWQVPPEALHDQTRIFGLCEAGVESCPLTP